MEDLMSVDFEEPVDLVITDPCYIKGDDGNWPLNAVERLSKSYVRSYFWALLLVVNTISKRLSNVSVL